MRIEAYIKLLDKFGALANTTLPRKQEPSEATSFTQLEDLLYPFKLSEKLKLLLSISGASDFDDMVLGYSNLLGLTSSMAYYNEFKSVFRELGSRWPDALFPIGVTQNVVLVLLSKDPKLPNEIYLFYPSNGDMCVYREYADIEFLLIESIQSLGGCSNGGVPKKSTDLESQPTECNLITGPVPDNWFKQ